MATNAYALPSMQLDADPSEYIWGDEESSVVSESEFTLYALLDPDKLPAPDYNDGWRYFISASLTPPTDDITSGGPYGSFTFNGTTVNVNTTDMVFGTPPYELELLSDKQVSPHGVFPTYFWEYELDFDGAPSTDWYNVQTGEVNPNDSLLYRTFLVNFANLTGGLNLHFDMYAVNGDGDFEVAPYSKDVQTTTSVPEPSTVLLFGIGLVGLAGMSRRRIKK